MKINPVSTEFQPEGNITSSQPVRPIEKVTVHRGETGEDVQRELSRESLNEQIEKLNQAVELVDKSLRFSLHDESERMQVLVIDSRNQEVIKEIPPEQVLDVVAKIREMVGLLLDEKV